MKTVIYSITFHSQWHCGSGESKGADLDALVIKDRDGLPYIPGKTIKGIVKDAFMDLVEAGYIAGKGSINRLFGMSPTKGTRGESSLTFFDNANLKNGVRTQIIEGGLTAHLYDKVTRTAIDETGVAKDMSLRSMEVTVSMQLIGQILNVDDSDLANVVSAIKMLKRIGGGRTRGLGRCTVEIIETKEG